MPCPLAGKTMTRRESGFTLIEVMVTVAIVAILGSLAYPNYVDYITRGRIVEAITKMSDFRVQMEQGFMDNRTYQGVPNCIVPNPLTPAKDYFGITCAAPTATTYTITAQGVGQMANFTYTIAQTPVGVVRATVSANPGWNTAPPCWVLKKSGEC